MTIVSKLSILFICKDPGYLLNTQVALECTMKKMDKLSKGWSGRVPFLCRFMEWIREESGFWSRGKKREGEGVAINKHCKVSKANVEVILLSGYWWFVQLLRNILLEQSDTRRLKVLSSSKLPKCFQNCLIVIFRKYMLNIFLIGTSTVSRKRGADYSIFGCSETFGCNTKEA